MTARDRAEQLLGEATPFPSDTPEGRQTNATRAQGFAVLALADSVERAAADMVAAVVGDERPIATGNEQPDPTHTLVIDDGLAKPIVWSGRWQPQPFLEYVPATYLRGVAAGELRVVAVTL